MGVLNIAPYKPASGTLGDAVQIANGFQAIQDVVNALDGNNIAAAAQLAITNLSLSQNTASALRLTGAAAGITLGGDVGMEREAADVLAMLSGDHFKADHGLRIPTKAGVPADSDYPLDEDGNVAVDITNHALYFRSGATWRQAATRTVRGAVNGAAGTVKRGSGFTVVKDSVGDWTVTFSTAFAAAPIVVVAAEAGTGVSHGVTVHTVVAGSFKVFGFNTTTGADRDDDFAFIAMEV